MIALIAHDRSKDEMVAFARRHREFFATRRLVATGATGRLISTALGLEVEQVAHGPHGGDLIIGGRVAMGQIEAVLFFRDPLTAHRELLDQYTDEAIHDLVTYLWTLK